jgi:hypothetical protein
MRHPELRDDEQFLYNVYESNDLSRVPYTSKRRGMTAYDIYGHSVSGLRPVFANRNEIPHEDSNGHSIRAVMP